MTMYLACELHGVGRFGLFHRYRKLRIQRSNITGATTRFTPHPLQIRPILVAFPSEELVLPE